MISNRERLVDLDSGTGVTWIAGAGAVGLFIAGSSIFGVPLAALAICAIAALVACNLSSKLSVVAFLLAVSFVPYWWGANLLGYLPVASIVALAVLPGSLIRGFRAGNRPVLYALFLAAFVSILYLSGASMRGHSFVFLAQWIPAFLVGLVLTHQAGIAFVRDAVSIIFTIVAMCAIVEYLADWNPYFGTAPDTQQYSKLGTLQGRGGVTRSEWSFGHSIALANSLALSIPMVLTSRLRFWMQSIAIAFIIVAIFTTFSRSGLVSAALAFAFTFWAARGVVSRRMAALTVVMLTTLAFAAPWAESVFTAASTETARSADHRLKLLELVPNLNAFGTASGYQETDGVFEWHGAISIDNAFLRISVNFGWVFGALCIAASAILMARVMLRRTSTPEMALASIVPALFTVALITQFAILVCFYVGIAASAAYRDRSTDNDLKSRRPETMTHAKLSEVA